MDQFDKYNKAPQTYKDFLRKSAQEDMDQLNQQLKPVVADQTMPTPAPTQPAPPKQTTPQQGSILGAAAPLTQAFGNQNPGVEVFSHGVNSGADFGAQVGTPVALPPGHWRILDAYGQDQTPGHVGDNTNSGYGNSIFAQNLDTGEKLRFSHLSKIGVDPNQTIDGGSVIGATGDTGNVTGPHLDLEYYNQNGQLADVLRSIYAQYLKMQQ